MLDNDQKPEDLTTAKLDETQSPLEGELEELRAKLAALEARNAELERLRTENSKRSERKVSAYKVGDFVTVKIPGYVDDEDGRVLEHVPGKAAVTVATGKGTFSIGDPGRIKRQSEEW